MKTFKIIGITGPAQCGKDTVADYIIDKRPAYRKTSFADPMKEMLCSGLGLTYEQLHGSLKDVIDVFYNCTPRHMLQTLGTEWGRDIIDGDIWIKAMEYRLSDIGGTFIIPDVRFENEAEFVRKHGRLIHIRGRDDNIEAGANHVSESGVNCGNTDIVIHNDDLIDSFYDCIGEALGRIECKTCTNNPNTCDAPFCNFPSCN